MKKLARIQALNTQVTAIDGEITQAKQEMSMLDHINDDAQRDAVVSESYDDRTGAKMTNADVVRISRHISALERSKMKLLTKRDKLVRELVDQ